MSIASLFKHSFSLHEQIPTNHLKKQQNKTKTNDALCTTPFFFSFKTGSLKIDFFFVFSYVLTLCVTSPHTHKPLESPVVIAISLVSINTVLPYQNNDSFVWLTEAYNHHNKKSLRVSNLGNIHFFL